MSRRTQRKWDGPAYRRVGVAEAESSRVRQLSDSDFRIRTLAREGYQSARLGLGRFSVAALAEELGRPIEEVREGFTRVCESLGWTFDPEARWLLIPEALEASVDGSPDQMDGYLKAVLAQSPPPALFQKLEARATQLLLEKRK